MDTCDHVSLDSGICVMTAAWQLKLWDPINHPRILISEKLKCDKTGILEWLNYGSSYNLLRIFYISGKIYRTKLLTRLNVNQTLQQPKMYVQIRKFNQVNKIVPDHTARSISEQGFPSRQKP